MADLPPPAAARPRAALQPVRCVYLLRSLDYASRGKTYIGYTVAPWRRLRQHNGEVKGGARKTRRNRPWEMLAFVHGFSSQVAALQFEWAWQNPTRSRFLKGALKHLKVTRSSFSAQIRLQVLAVLLSVESWDGEHERLSAHFLRGQWAPAYDAAAAAAAHDAAAAAGLVRTRRGGKGRGGGGRGRGGGRAAGAGASSGAGLRGEIPGREVFGDHEKLEELLARELAQFDRAGSEVGITSGCPEAAGVLVRKARKNGGTGGDGEEEADEDDEDDGDGDSVDEDSMAAAFKCSDESSEGDDDDDDDDDDDEEEEEALARRIQRRRLADEARRGGPSERGALAAPEMAGIAVAGVGMEAGAHAREEAGMGELWEEDWASSGEDEAGEEMATDHRLFRCPDESSSSSGGGVEAEADQGCVGGAEAVADAPGYVQAAAGSEVGAGVASSMAVGGMATAASLAPSMALPMAPSGVIDLTGDDDEVPVGSAASDRASGGGGGSSDAWAGGEGRDDGEQAEGGKEVEEEESEEDVPLSQRLARRRRRPL